MIKKLFVLLIIGLIGAYYFYDQIFLAKNPSDSTKIEIIVPEGSNIEQVGELLETKGLIRNRWLFEFISTRKNYSNNIRSGRFTVRKSISLNDLINNLRIGSKNVVNFTFNNIHTLADLAGKAGKTFKADSLTFLDTFNDVSIREHYGFTKENYPTMFIPNTYEFNLNTSPEDFIVRMAKEFNTFWNEDRTTKMRALNLSQSEVVTLASIVQAEQQAYPSEWKRIAGLYLNRVRKNIALQSDPTIKYAVGDWSIKRVLKKHLKKESPYNTYLNPGLPPGPILFPDIKAIDAVLNAEKHSYYYMCAKADFSGKHEFSKNLSMHNNYAAAYRKALNERKIYQ